MSFARRDSHLAGGSPRRDRRAGGYTVGRTVGRQLPDRGVGAVVIPFPAPRRSVRTAHAVPRGGARTPPAPGPDRLADRRRGVRARRASGTTTSAPLRLTRRGRLVVTLLTLAAAFAAALAVAGHLALA